MEPETNPEVITVPNQSQEPAKTENTAEQIPVRYGFTVAVLENDEIRLVPIGKCGFIELNGLAQYALLKTEENLKVISGSSIEQKVDELHTVLIKVPQSLNKPRV